jgi:hypothetical protein
VPAFPAKKDITDNRDIIIKFDGFFAVGTEGVRFYNRLASWYPVYTNIQKAADNSTKYKNYYRGQVVHFPVPIILLL